MDDVRERRNGSKAMSLKSRPQVSWRAFSAIIAAALIWSTSFAVTKVLLENVPPLTIGAIRFSAAALILAVLVRLQRGWKPVGLRSAAAMGGAGLLGITAYFGLENIGVDLATASDAAVIVASFPVVTLLLEIAFQRGRASVAGSAGMALAIFGVWLIVRQSANAGGSHRLLGDIILLAAGIAWAGYNMVARRTSPGHSALTSTYYQTLAGAAGFVVLTPIEYRNWQTPDLQDIGMLAFLAGMCSIAAFVLYNYGLRDVSPSAAVNILNLVPVFGLASAALVTGEQVGTVELLGCAVVVVGVAFGATAKSGKASRNDSGFESVKDPAGESRRDGNTNGQEGKECHGLFVATNDTGLESK
ncbi:DMT family transporter [Streptomyces sp. NPDC048361]|uniref:DMT family transporter n=1 Tax=Streptomyces sp. NPDC048361 TaxID=3154720 RepID=UPI003423947A